MNIKTLFLALIFIFPFVISNAQSYKIDVEISDLNDTEIYLGYYYGDKTYVRDTIKLDSKGQGTFQGDSLLDQGLYIIVMPAKSYFDILVGEDQEFSVQTTSTDLVNNLKIKGSAENQALKDFQQYMMSQNKKSMEIQSRLKQIDKDSDSTTIYREQLNDLAGDMKIFWNKTIEENEGNLLSVLIKVMKNPEIPEIEVPEDITNKDSVRWFHSYNYNRTHYFDNIDFNDERFLRTPIFYNKIETFFTKVIIQDPDTIIHYIDIVATQAESNKDMFQYLIRYFLNTFQKSNIMGMDKVVVHVAETYYLSDKVDWLDEETLDKLRDQIAKLRFNLIGNIAQDMKMETITQEYAKLHEIKSKYTLVYFFEPHCGHCKKTTPKVFDIYNDFSRDEFEVFAVYTQTDKEEWSEYIYDKNFDTWINVWDPYNLTNFRFFYNINSTPIMYLLDENKKIIAKKISAETLRSILEIELGKTTSKDKIEKEQN